MLIYSKVVTKVDNTNKIKNHLREVVGLAKNSVDYYTRGNIQTKRVSRFIKDGVHYDYTHFKLVDGGINMYCDTAMGKTIKRLTYDAFQDYVNSFEIKEVAKNIPKTFYENTIECYKEGVSDTYTFVILLGDALSDFFWYEQEGSTLAPYWGANIKGKYLMKYDGVNVEISYDNERVFYLEEKARVAIASNLDVFTFVKTIYPNETLLKSMLENGYVDWGVLTWI